MIKPLAQSENRSVKMRKHQYGRRDRDYEENSGIVADSGNGGIIAGGLRIIGGIGEFGV